MEYTNVRLLLTIIFLHVLSIFMVLPVLPCLFSSNGASHFMIGILTTLNYVFHCIKKELLAVLSGGKKYAITVSLYVSFVYFFTVVFYNDLLSVFAVTCLWALTIDIVNLGKQFMLRTEPEEKRLQIYYLADLTKCCASTAGAILGSHIYSANQDPSSNFIISSCLTLICILVFQRIDSDDSALEKDPSHIHTLPDMCRARLQKLKEIEIVNSWNSFMLTSTYTFIYCTYWTRICYIVIDKYNTNYIHLGYAIALENIIIFACGFIEPLITERCEDRRKFLLHSMFISGLLLAGFYSAPNYNCSLTLFSILTFFYTMVNKLLDDDVLNLRYEADVAEASKTVGALINIIVPIFSGIVYDCCGANALDLIAAFSLSVYIYMITKSLLQIKKEETEDIPSQAPESAETSEAVA